MPDTTPNQNETSGHVSSHDSFAADHISYEGIDLNEIVSRLLRGIAQIIGFTLLGLAIGAFIYVAANPFTSATSSMRLTFAFSGFGKGEYPDHSKFQTEDVFAPDIIAEVVKRQGLENIEGLASKLRAALSIEGLISPSVIKDRDRLRAAGQTPTQFFADEYLVTLTLPRNFPLSSRQRELILSEIVEAYHQKFQRTYADMPLTFGNAFETLRDADYSEYELILTEEIKNITDFLRQQLNVEDDGTSSGNSNPSRTFRSRTTNLSFSDLLQQTRLFEQIRLNQTLGVIYQYGLSRNRNVAMMKMDYYLQTLGDQEQEAIEKENLVDGLLTKSQEHSQDYVLGIKSQVAQQSPGSPILDQGLIDSLLANDAYNFLVHRALDAGMAVKIIQANKARLLERRKNMQAFIEKNDFKDQPAEFVQVQKSLADLESAYNVLISNIRMTHADYAGQQFADAVRISMQPVTGSYYRPLFIAIAIGGLVGSMLGIGLSLMGIAIAGSKTGSN